MSVSSSKISAPRNTCVGVLSASLICVALASPALAQGGAASPKAKAAAQPAATPVASEPAPAMPLVQPPSRAPEPVFDEGTAQRISAAMLSYSAIEVRGGWLTLPPTVAKLAAGANNADVALLRQRLVMTDDLAPELEKGTLYDAAVTAAVRRFQLRHGLEQTGTPGPKTLAALNVPVGKRLRQLAMTLDRLAETDFTFGERYVVVNLPAAFAEAVVGNRVVRRHVVQVGRPDRPSPTLTSYITSINLNPTWTVPLGILKKDVIPKMRKDPGYAARMHMKVLDGAGREVDPHSVDWNSDRAPNFTIRQDSGNWNALGAVKIDFPNPYSVYMHDTNHKDLFSADYRFQSSGCTRVENPRDLAAWVLEETPGWSRAQIDAGIAKGQKLDIKVARKIPVAWVYMTGWVTRDGTVHFRDDIYGHDEHPARPLMADARPAISTAARASGFVLQSADTPPESIEQVSYLDSQ
ncbi:MAG: L,D-transpeptidase YcbB [Sphingomonadales bacterium]|nr:L,D-transpeptidase YcbB [Sphingomonadales bacterium]